LQFKAQTSASVVKSTIYLQSFRMQMYELSREKDYSYSIFSVDKIYDWVRFYVLVVVDHYLTN